MEFLCLAFTVSKLFLSFFGLCTPGTVVGVRVMHDEDVLSAYVRFATIEQAAAALQYDGFRTLGHTL